MRSIAINTVKKRSGEFTHERQPLSPFSDRKRQDAIILETDIHGPKLGQQREQLKGMQAAKRLKDRDIQCQTSIGMPKIVGNFIESNLTTPGIGVAKQLNH